MYADTLRESLVRRLKRINHGILDIVINEDGVLKFAYPILKIGNSLLQRYQPIFITRDRKSYSANFCHGVSMSCV
jgi:hypothetical protein